MYRDSLQYKGLGAYCIAGSTICAYRSHRVVLFMTLHNMTVVRNVLDRNTRESILSRNPSQPPPPPAPSLIPLNHSRIFAGLQWCIAPCSWCDSDPQTHWGNNTCSKSLHRHPAIAPKLQRRIRNQHLYIHVPVSAYNTVSSQYPNLSSVFTAH